MADVLLEYGLFLLKSITVVVAIAVVVALLVTAIGALVARGKGAAGGDAEGGIEIRKYNERLDDIKEALSISLLAPAARKLAEKDRKAREKRERKAAKVAAKKAKKQRRGGQTVAPDTTRPRTFVLDFDGDMRAQGVETLRREITAVLTSATPEDEVVLRLDSGGGTVTGYGLAAAQLDRLKSARVPLIVCVDQIAASGGYMMACVGNRLIAAPFAVLGSIGVVAQIPNFHRLLEQWNIDVEILTAGKFKRTLTLFGENSDEGRAKFLQDIERIHDQFKQYVEQHRPGLDIEAVSTGEIWSGQDALDRKLADALGTSDDYLVTACGAREVLLIGWREKKSLMDRVSFGVEAGVDRLAMRWLQRLWRQRWP